MSNRKASVMAWTIWINMALWAAALGAVMAPWSPERANYPKYIVGGGFIFSALLQHWAYYNLRKWFNR